MTALQEWILRLLAALGLPNSALNQAQIYWPGLIAAFSTVTVCTLAALLILDASRRTVAVPHWSYLQRSVGLLAAEVDALRQIVAGLNQERDSVCDEIDALREEKFALQQIKAQRQEEEERLAAITSRLEGLDQDRAEAAALRIELEHLRAEKAALVCS